MVSNINIKNAKIAFRNFEGKEGKFNPAGRRNFCVILEDQELVAQLVNDGWNIKYLKPRDDEDPEQPYITVSVKFEPIKPNIYMVTSKNKVELFEDTVGQLDYAEITNVDLSIRPYQWEVNGKTGIKAYLKTMYVTIEEDPFAASYEFPSEKEELPWE